MINKCKLKQQIKANTIKHRNLKSVKKFNSTMVTSSLYEPTRDTSLYFNTSMCIYFKLIIAHIDYDFNWDGLVNHDNSGYIDVKFLMCAVTVISWLDISCQFHFYNYFHIMYIYFITCHQLWYYGYVCEYCCDDSL